MKPETAAFRRKSGEFLVKAQGMLDSGWPDEAGRAAYLAGFHAAQALLFEATGRTAKTHGGVQSEFSRLVRDDVRFDVEQRRFLGRAYNLKAVADYGTDPDRPVTQAQANDAIKLAISFVAAVCSLIEASAAAPPRSP